MRRRLFYSSNEARRTLTLTMRLADGFSNNALYMYFASRQADFLECSTNNFDPYFIQTETIMNVRDFFGISNTFTFVLYSDEVNSFELDLSTCLGNDKYSIVYYFAMMSPHPADIDAIFDITIHNDGSITPNIV